MEIIKHQQHDITNILKKLRDYLLHDAVGNKIAKIVLFGSHAKGYATPNSDMDIMIFTADGKDTEKRLLDKIYDFMIEHNTPLEIVVSDVSDLYLSKDYFTYNIIHYGVEVYSMEKSELKKHMIRDLHNLAEEYLESAEDVLEKGRMRLAIDAGYNSAELSAKALILLKEDDLPGSHGGIVSLFGQLFIKTEEINKDVGRTLNMALELRNKARYKPNVSFSKDDTDLVLNLARTFLKIVSNKIEDKTG
ncbi:MAG: HEPN domain-containing protein [Nitrospirota bacterium]